MLADALFVAAAAVWVETHFVHWEADWVDVVTAAFPVTMHLDEERMRFVGAWLGCRPD